jgi:hypothetical protein
MLQVYAAADPVVCDKPGRLGLEASPEFYRSVSRSLCGVHTIVYALQSFPDKPRLLWTAGNPHTELDVSCMEVMGGKVRFRTREISHKRNNFHWVSKADTLGGMAAYAWIRLKS